MTTQRVVFLDFDGVINTDRMAIKAITSQGEWRDDYGLRFDAESVTQLEKIIQATEARVVAITSWKQYGLDYLQEVWEYRHMPGAISDATPDYRTDFVMGEDGQTKCVSVPVETKGEGIEEWLLQEQMEGRETRYVILDDIQSFSDSQQDYFIQICPHCGITEADAARAIAILTKDSE